MDTQFDAVHTGKIGLNVKLDISWLVHLSQEFEKPYMKALKSFLNKERMSGKVIYPKGSEIFRSLELTPFNTVKVVILGQDPYHGPNQAHGLCFSVNQGVAIPPSLLNIYKELKSDLGIPHKPHGDLSGWAKQGVLLLNATLTVENGLAGSHQKKGWETFTDEVIKSLNNTINPVVFVLWGAHAQQKSQLISNKRHFIIKSPHPSPLSAHRGFLGSKPFSKMNDFLKKSGQTTIDWSL